MLAFTKRNISLLHEATRARLNTSSTPLRWTVQTREFLETTRLRSLLAEMSAVVPALGIYTCAPPSSGRYSASSGGTAIAATTVVFAIHLFLHCLFVETAFHAFRATEGCVEGVKGRIGRVVARYDLRVVA